MNKFQQRVYNLVPELGEIKVVTGNCFDSALAIKRAMEEAGMPTDNENYFITILSGVYTMFDTNGETKIACSQDIGEMLPDNQLRAVILHEVAHIRNGDMKPGNEIVTINEDFEIKADRYALDRGVSVIDLLNAITTVTVYSIRQMAAWKIIVEGVKGKCDVEYGVREALKDLPALMGKRFEALMNS